jgi:hypothetical protein
MAVQPFVGPWPLFKFLDLLIQSVGLLGWEISPSQGRYLHTEQHKHRINHTDIHASSGIRTHTPSVLAGEDSSCHRSRDHCEGRLRPNTLSIYVITLTAAYGGMIRDLNAFLFNFLLNNKYDFVRLEVLSGDDNSYQTFQETPLNMKAAGSSEALVTVYHITRCLHETVPINIYIQTRKRC